MDTNYLIGFLFFMLVLDRIDIWLLRRKYALLFSLVDSSIKTANKRIDTLENQERRIPQTTFEVETINGKEVLK